MLIQGLQKLTLLDYPEKMACTVFLGGCNFRCPFCHNADLILSGAETIPALSEETLMTYLHKRKQILEGVCISGGEPLLYPEAAELIQKIKDLGYAVKLDTNGSFPDRLQNLVSAELVDYVAMDIKNAPDRYAETIGRPGFDPAPVLESAAFLLSGVISYEFRTTVTRELHSARDFEAIGCWLRGAEKYFLQAFIDSGTVLQKGLHGYTKTELEQFRQILKKDIPNTEIRGI